MKVAFPSTESKGLDSEVFNHFVCSAHSDGGGCSHH